jgi:hypothetical protein
MFLPGPFQHFSVSGNLVRHGLKIFTTDSDFAAYARHIPLKLHLPLGVALR